jgi:hypothetical protein
MSIHPVNARGRPVTAQKTVHEIKDQPVRVLRDWH